MPSMVSTSRLRSRKLLRRSQLVSGIKIETGSSALIMGNVTTNNNTSAGVMVNAGSMLVFGNVDASGNNSGLVVQNNGTLRLLGVSTITGNERVTFVILLNRLSN